MILLDTHVVIWLALNPEKISAKAHTAIAETRTNSAGLAISDITLWEIAAGAHKQRIHLDTTLESFLSEVESRFIVLPITAQIAVRAFSLSAAYPRDPADRMLAATALVHGIPLLTADSNIRRSKQVATIW